MGPTNTSDRKRNEVIKRNWGSWENFMQSYGLKPWNVDDVEEANSILAALMKNEQEMNLSPMGSYKFNAAVILCHSILCLLMLNYRLYCCRKKSKPF